MNIIFFGRLGNTGNNKTLIIFLTKFKYENQVNFT